MLENGEESKASAIVSSSESRWRQSRTIFGERSRLLLNTASRRRDAARAADEREGRRKRKNKKKQQVQRRSRSGRLRQLHNKDPYHSSSSSSLKGSPLICVQTLGKPVSCDAT
ncbi:hypothetical protein MTO96_035767 [Rhipicephalus appendiculatus]